MGVIQRGIIFSGGTMANAVLFLFHSRVVLEVQDVSQTFPSGPATPAINMLPDVIMLAIGALQLGLIVYFLGGLGQERSTVQRAPR